MLTMYAACMNWSRLAPVRTAVLVIAAFTCMAVAAFLFHIIAGLVVTGVLLLALEFLTQPERVSRA